MKPIKLLLLLLIFSNSLSANYSDSTRTDSIISLIPTFLGNSTRNFYGDKAPQSLDFIWRHYLGEGITVISRSIGEKKWKGAGWTGQPLLFKEGPDTFLIQGAYDHNLKKINATTGKLVWQYTFDDVVKGTGSYFYNKNAKTEEERHIILQGSRLGIGNYLDSKHIPSYRAISYITGNELWRFDVRWTDSYSRDADGSALIIDSLAYIGLENSMFTILDPDPQYAYMRDGMFQPAIITEYQLYNMQDVYDHGKPKVSNIVTESSPSLLGERIYISSGSGHLFGYNIKEDTIDWDFYIGSDIDGSPVVSSDSCILQSIERQYIPGKGGVYKFNPSLPPDSSVVWYFPVRNKKYAGWEGGIIGSVCVNDYYVNDTVPKLAAFVAVDGYMYVVQHDILLPDSVVPGPRERNMYSTPKLIFKFKTGPSISTPIFIDNTLIAATYNGIYLFRHDENLQFELIDERPGEFESTPISYNGKIYIASRNGYLYCLGDK